MNSARIVSRIASASDAEVPKHPLAEKLVNELLSSDTETSPDVADAGYRGGDGGGASGGNGGGNDNTSDDNGGYDPSHVRITGDLLDQAGIMSSSLDT